MMIFSFTIGWWAVPLSVSIIFLSVVAVYELSRSRQRSPYSSLSNAADAFIGAFYYGGAIILSLVAWLIYAFAV